MLQKMHSQIRLTYKLFISSNNKKNKWNLEMLSIIRENLVAVMAIKNA